MQKIRRIPLILILCLLFSLLSPSALALEGPSLTAQAVLLADLDSGIVLYRENDEASRSIASLTKVMTVLLALEAVERGEAGLEDVVTAGADCRNGMREDSSSVYLAVGEQMSLRDLIYCAAVSSGNDACNVIASYLAGSIPAFVERMNARAGELGCSATHFVDPNGLSYDGVSSARDLYRITLAAMELPLFMEICDTVSYTVPATNLSPARELKTSNALLSAQGPYGAGFCYEGAHGVKTGYTRAAGYCLISTVERDGMRLLAVVLGCDGPYLSNTDTRYNFVDTIRLYDWAFSHFMSRAVILEGQVLARAEVELAMPGELVDLLPVRGLSLSLPYDLSPGEEDLRVSLYESPLRAPIREGEILGRATLYYNDEPVAFVDLAAANSVMTDYPALLREFLDAETAMVHLYITRIWSAS